MRRVSKDINDEHRYDDIIDYDYQGSSNHRHMPRSERAAQFMPFAALEGYGDAISETGRQTSSRITLDESEKEVINNKLKYLNDNKYLDISVKYFIKDTYKDGGKYEWYNGRVKRVDDYYHRIVFIDKSEIDFDDIVEIRIVGVDDGNY